MLDKLKKLLEQGKRTVVNTANRASNFVRQNPTPAGYVRKQIVNQLNKDRGGVSINQMAREIPNAARQTFSRQGLASGGGLREAGKGVYTGAVDLAQRINDISPGNLAMRVISPNKYAAQTQNTNKFFDTLRSVATPRGTDAQQAIHAGFRVGAQAPAYMVGEEGLIGAATKVAPKIAANALGRFAIRRGADVASGQILTPKDQMVGGSRVKQALSDLAFGSALDVAGLAGKGASNAAQNVVDNAAKTSRYREALATMGASIPKEYTTISLGKNKIANVNYAVNSMNPRLSVSTVPDSYHEFYLEKGRLPNKGEVVPKRYDRHGGDTTIIQDKETGRVVTWDSKNQKYKDYITETSPKEPKKVKAFAALPGSDALSSEAKAKIQTFDPFGIEKPAESNKIRFKDMFSQDKLKNETGDQYMSRKVGYQIDNGVVKIEQDPVSQSWKSTIIGMGDNDRSVITGSKNDVIRQTYQRLNPEVDFGARYDANGNNLDRMASPQSTPPPLSNEAKQTFYHGTNADFNNFDISKAGQNDVGFYGKGVYLTGDKVKAGGYGKNIKEVLPNLDKTYVLDKSKGIDLEEIARLTGANVPSGPRDVFTARDIIMQNPERFTENLKKQGYDSVRVKANNGLDELVVFDPKKLSPQSTQGAESLINPSNLSVSNKNARAKSTAYWNSQLKNMESPPKIEKTRIEIAQGNPELDSTQAARRILDKKGIDWQTGQPIQPSTQGAVPKTTLSTGNGMKIDIENPKTQTINVPVGDKSIPIKATIFNHDGVKLALYNEKPLGGNLYVLADPKTGATISSGQSEAGAIMHAKLDNPAYWNKVKEVLSTNKKVEATQGASKGMPKINLLKSGEQPLMIEGSKGTKRTIPLADYQGVMVNPKKIKVTGSGATGKIEVGKPTAFIPPKDIGVGTKIKRAFTSGDVELARQGKSGQELADKIKFQRTNAEQLRGGYQVKLQEALQGLNQSERNVVGQVSDGKMQVNNPRIIQAVQKTRAILDDIGGKAQEVGLKIKTPSGEVPFRMKENYFPRVYDFTDLQKAGQRQRAMQHLVDSGQAQNIADADRMLETFIKDNTVRRAGNLEHARVLDLPGYETDPLKAVNKYIDSASRRLTEANTFGSTDEVAKRLIDRVRTEGGDYKYAQEVFDLMTGQKKYQNLGVDLATKFNYITKLDLGFITNATQPINTAVKTGIINTLDGVMKAYLTPNKAGKFARQIGAVTDEVVKGRAEGLTMGRLMETILSPFSFIERKNRVISAVAGKNFTEQLANKILKNPESKYALRQLKSIGIDPEKIIAQGKITADDILGGAKATSDKTQFKVDAIDIPPGWKTNIGRLLTQFKSFSFQQTKFVRDEVAKEAGAGNFAPLVKLIALAVPASFVAQSVRNKLTGRNPSEEEKSLDVRKLDTYLKAFGTIPTDLVIQGKFLKDTYANQYATPLKKIGRTISSVAGPTVGEAFNIANAFEQAGTIKKQNQQYNQEKDPYLETKRIASGYLPFVGEAIKNKVFAYPATYAKGSEVAGKTITQQIKDLQSGKKTGDSPIAQMADGRFRYRVGTESKYADTPEEAQIGLNKAKFKSSGKAMEIIDGMVYRRSKDGDVQPLETKLSYDTKLTTQKLENAKTAKNMTEWMKLAEQQEKNLATQLQDPTLDELEKTELQQKYDKLVADAQKYAGYGGFTKGKSGGSSKTKKAKVFTIPSTNVADSATSANYKYLDSLLAGAASRPTFSTANQIGRKVALKKQTIKKG